MSAPVRSHQAHTSIRSRSARTKTATPGPPKRRHEGEEQRQSVKAILGAPWVVQWGETQGEEVVGAVVAGCGGVKGFHAERERRKRVKPKPNAAPVPQQVPPPVLSTLTFGLNEVIKRLERARLDLEVSVDALIAGYEDFPFGGARRAEVPSLIATAPEDQMRRRPSRIGVAPVTPLKVIFVCVEDINPRELVDHVPRYVASWNALVAASRARLDEWVREGEEGRRDKAERLVKGREMWLVALGKGSEQVLAHAVGLRRVGVMGVTNEFPNLEKIISHLTTANISPPLPPFPLHPTSASTLATPIYAPTILKAIHTTTPADPKSRKAARVAAVRVARDRQKRSRREQVERTRRTLGWDIGGGKWAGGAEQKRRDRAARGEKGQRVKGLVDGKKRKRVVKETAAERRKKATIGGKVLV